MTRLMRTTLSSAGLISIGRSAMPELGLNAVTESPLLGPTRNPWDVDYTPEEGVLRRRGRCGCRGRRSCRPRKRRARLDSPWCGTLRSCRPQALRGRNAGEEAFRSIVDLTVNGCVSRTVRDTAAWLEATQRGTRAVRRRPRW